MDVRSIEDVAPVVEHNGTVPVWWLVNPREMQDITDGGYGGETAEVSQGDLIYIPPDKVHSLRPISDHAPIHCFCFAVGVKGAGEIDYTTH
ncbi:MAG: hypothetical protein EXQ79_04320 [Acidimicrobiia bacterium]|nr:hypothetical protein [Acidimicrobiia bacterium]